jgi:phasin family protein
MSSTDQNTPAAKSGRRGRKTARNPKPKQAQSPQADQLEPAEEAIVPAAAPAETAPIEAAAEPADIAAIEMAPTEHAAPIDATAADDTAPTGTKAPEDMPPVDTTASENTGPAGAGTEATAAPVSLQTIANAYGDYTRRSLEETRSFVEKLKGAKSLDKAVEVQTEFAHHAFEIFVAESRKIYGLHKELARQTLKPLEGLMNKPNRDQR